MFEVTKDSATRPRSRALRNNSIVANTIIGLRLFVQNTSVKKVETVGTCAYYNNTFFSVTSTAGTKSTFILSMANDKAMAFCMASSSSNWKIYIHDFYTKEERLLSRSFKKTLTNIRKPQKVKRLRPTTTLSLSIPF